MPHRCHLLLLATALLSLVTACEGEAVVASDASSFPRSTTSSSERSIGLTQGTCKSFKVAGSDWHVGAEVTDVFLTALDDARVDDDTIATVAPLEAVWRTSQTTQASPNVFTNDYVAHVLLVCGIREGTTTMRVHRHDSDDDAGTLHVFVERS